MSDLINCTIGIPLKFVPVIFIEVAVAGAIVWDTSATVGTVGWGTSAKDKLPEPVSYTHLRAHET